MFYPVTWSVTDYDEIKWREAERDYYLLGARVVKPEPRERLLVRVGDLLIAAGLKLQGQHQPVMVPAPKARQSL